MVHPRTRVPSLRLAFVAAGLWTAILGLGFAYLLAPDAWAVDAQRNLDAARSLVAGTFGSDRGYLYTPLAAALTIPATWLPAGVAIAGWLVLKSGLLAAGAWRETRRLAGPAIVLAAVAAILFLPSVHDLLLGNVSIILLAAVALVVWRPDGLLAGALLGLVLATVPKPLLIPILVWMAFYRPRALVGAVAVAAVATAIGLIVLGIEPYRAWIDILRAPEYLDGRPTYGNLSLFAWPTTIAVPLAIAAVIAAAVGIARGPWPGLVACIGVGLLVAPYTMAYSAVLLLLVARPLASVSPWMTVALVVLAPIGIVLAFPVWVGGVVVVALVAPAAGWSVRGRDPSRVPGLSIGVSA